ncbi:hypothetical protein AOQ84DRAFT_420951 [Glonium stellatum]|uniref:Serine hydrolase domain-containing protein n=1 Tax=Glonium stellatum TaxID=574774 RepID=A0A8E2EQC6_9PEZI|nr:hypothetical protein AOQ84DRAFT_420951 [Glonium stellatum]
MISKVIEELEDPSLHLPRILCLHGGGTNAKIFRTQCRVLRAHLKSAFRLCFADAPFYSQAGPDVTSVYKEYGPFRRWLRWKPEHPEIEAATAVRCIEKSLETAMREDDMKGATGEWVGLLGFSQGAKMAASLLFRQQVREEKLGRHGVGTNFRFGILLAGRGPLVSLDPELVMTPSLVDAAHLGFQIFPDRRRKEHVLRLPTVHVHGMRDQGLNLHRQLLEQYCEEGSTRLVEWDGHHRVPIETKVVTAIVKHILAVAQGAGVLAT